ncbi:MAG: Trk system potassium transporter TrkA [Candidatus Hydrogenedentes bacterium]|nr:Trk system potassium transporter TrkA [Candidatus Hydrogenedentota bacterium]
MYIIIIGAGEVGGFVARELVAEGHDVVLIESDSDLARRLDATMNAIVVCGSGVNPAVLEQAGISQADLLLAVTATDEVNLIACMTARKHGGPGLRTLARVRWSWRGEGEPALSAADLGLDALISPRQEIAAEAVSVLRFAGSGEVWELADAQVALIAMSLSEDSPLVHDSLAGVRRDFAKDFLVVAVQGREGVRIPSGDDHLAPDERAYVLTLSKYATELAILSGQPWAHVHRIMIVGCGNTGLAVARALEERHMHVTVIEEDVERAEQVAGLLRRSLVIQGDGSSPEFLQRQIEETRSDAVVVLLKNPEESLLIGIFARSLGAKKVVVRCDEGGYVPLAHKLGVDAVLSPNRAMIGAILRYVRRGSVESTLLLGDRGAEIIQYKVPASAPGGILEKPLSDIKFPEGALVGAVVRGGAAFIASGDTILRPGDTLFIACNRESIRGVERLFS